MTMHRQYWVYILSNVSRTLYVGVTSDLPTRLHQHREKLAPGFTQRYNVSELVYYEVHADANAAIAREKQLKGWRRGTEFDRFVWGADG
jgi:putative endonuclease